ncbi:hypothetical protein D6851_11685 [Altericroceibacterium spongiae]|uniref:Uncharacterized protein n=2 Tax=Altericroceibacterium spongiae TaxID=2320269 RepID=A0A420EJ74_9SPHN|nr:hypothetical protein D6851_11685 [Altericroceibacterium spongiae]
MVRMSAFAHQLCPIAFMSSSDMVDMSWPACGSLTGVPVGAGAGTGAAWEPSRTGVFASAGAGFDCDAAGATGARTAVAVRDSIELLVGDGVALAEVSGAEGSALLSLF